MVWRWELRTKKNGDEAWTKPPYQCAYPKVAAKSNDPSTWDTYEAAVAAVAAGLADGIGFMLKDSEVAAADLDHVRDAQTGELIGWAKATVCRGGSARALSRGDCFRMRLALYRLGARAASCIASLRSTARAAPASSSIATARVTSRSRDCRRDPARTERRSMIISTRYWRASSNPAGAGEPRLRFQYRRAAGRLLSRPIENGAPEGERSEKFQEVVWHLASAGWTIEQIVDELAKYPNGIGLKYANRLLAEVTRSFNKWQSRRRASATGSGAGAAGTPWPQIQIIPGELPRIVNEAEDALLLLGREIYQRGGMLVRPVLNKSLKASADRETESWQLVPVTRSYLVEVLMLCRAVSALRQAGTEVGRRWTRQKKWRKLT